MAAAAAAKSLQSCLTLCDPLDGSPPGSPVPGILEARVLEWGAIAFSRSSGRWCETSAWGQIIKMLKSQTVYSVEGHRNLYEILITEE